MLCTSSLRVPPVTPLISLQFFSSALPRHASCALIPQELLGPALGGCLGASLSTLLISPVKARFKPLDGYIFALILFSYIHIL